MNDAQFASFMLGLLQRVGPLLAWSEVPAALEAGKRLQAMMQPSEEKATEPPPAAG